MSLTSLDSNRAVVGLGGNALERDGDVFSSEALHEAMTVITEAFNGVELAVVHGSGPQYESIKNGLSRSPEYGEVARMVQEKF